MEITLIYADGFMSKKFDTRAGALKAAQKIARKEYGLKGSLYDGTKQEKILFDEQGERWVKLESVQEALKNITL